MLRTSPARSGYGHWRSCWPPTGSGATGCEKDGSARSLSLRRRGRRHARQSRTPQRRAATDRFPCKATVCTAVGRLPLDLAPGGSGHRHFFAVPAEVLLSTSCLTSLAGGIDVLPEKEKGKLAVIRLSVPRKVAEALPRFEGVPVGDSSTVGRLIADTIQIRADELLEAVEQCPVREAGQVADMRRLVDELDALARSYERLVGESEPPDEG